jgi:hypothetical protein
MPSPSSSNTGAASPGARTAEKPNGAGTQPSGLALTTSQQGGELSTARMHPVALARDPDTNTAAMQSSMRSLGVEAVIKRKNTFPVDPTTGEMKGWRSVINGAEITLAVSANLSKARDVVRAAMAPASNADMELWIAELSLITAKRNTSDAAAELLLTAYTTRLANYPGDIVRETLQTWAGKWFPTWGELKEILDARVAERGTIQTALSVYGAVLPKQADEKPAAYYDMSPVDRHEWLLFEAKIARRTDPDKAREFEQEADSLLAQIRATGV